MIGPNDTSDQTLFPVFFMPHGSPYIDIVEHPVVDFYKDFHKTIERPDAIVIWTAHWESEVQQISSIVDYETIHDFGGFPEELYKMTYPCKGDPTLAKEVQELFKKNGVEAQLDDKRGIDHGAWSILYLMYPDADIPVVQMSVNPNATPEEIYKIGQSLQPLREKKILVIGSGATVHNLRLMTGPLDAPTEQWALDFDDWLIKNIKEWNMENLFNYLKDAPLAEKCVPTPEHYHSLLYAAGAGSKNKKVELLHRSSMFGNLTYTPYRFD